MSESVESRATWWILGIVAALIVAGISVVFKKLDSIEVRLNTIEVQRLNKIEIDQATISNKILNIQSQMDSSMREQVATIVAIGTINTKLSTLSMEDTYIKEQIAQVRAMVKP